MLKQPVGIVKLTNVAVIRYKTKGKNFEIACYKNKVIDWRNGIENNISEVLQIEEIFIDAEKGKKVPQKMFAKYFPKMTKTEIVQEILNKGTMQVSTLEREAKQEENEKAIIDIISKKIIHPKSKKRFSKETISQALKEIHFNIQFNDDSKKQAMRAISMLEQYYNVVRTGKLFKIKCVDQQLFEKLEKDLHFEVIQKDDQFAQVLVRPEFSQIINQYQEELQPFLIDNSYSNQTTSSINEDIEVALEKKQDISLPFHSLKANRKELQEEKKEVVGYNQIGFSKAPTNEKSEKICALCQGSTFPDLAQYKDHLRSDWHKENLKRKMKGLPSLSKEESINMAILETMIKQ